MSMIFIRNLNPILFRMKIDQTSEKLLDMPAEREFAIPDAVAH